MTPADLDAACKLAEETLAYRSLAARSTGTTVSYAAVDVIATALLHLHASTATLREERDALAEQLADLRIRADERSKMIDELREERRRFFDNWKEVEADLEACKSERDEWLRMVKSNGATHAKIVAVHESMLSLATMAATAAADERDSARAELKACRAAVETAFYDGFTVAQDWAEVSEHDGWHRVAPHIDWTTANRKYEQKLDEIRAALNPVGNDGDGK